VAKALWLSLSREARSQFIRVVQPLTPISTSNPHTTSGEFMGGIATICPELTIESLVYRMMETLDKTFASDCTLVLPGSKAEQLSNSRSIPLQALEFYRKVLHLKVNKLPLDQSILFGCAIEFGKVFKYRECSASMKKTLDGMLEQGLVCNNVEWHYAFMRCSHLITTLGMYIDEIRRVIKDESVPRIKMLAPVFNETDESGSLLCFNCKQPPETGKELRICSSW
jgi:hypothetical protein